MLNTIACPDLKKTSLLAAANFIDRYPNIPIVNHPRLVLETTRHKNSIRLNAISGVKFPKTEKTSWNGVSVNSVVREILDMGFIA